MRGVPVFVIFIITNVIAFLVFIGIFKNSMETSIIQEEQAARSYLNNILRVYDEKNKASINYYNAVVSIPKIDSYILSTMSNYIVRAINIEAGETIIEKPLTFQEYQYLQARIQERINQINNIARNYPVLRTNENYILASESIKPLEKSAQDIIKLYNTHVEEYNKITTRVPGNIVAGFMGKFPFEKFLTGTNITDTTSHLFEK